jgi:hypothetical protein
VQQRAEIDLNKDCVFAYLHTCPMSIVFASSLGVCLDGVPFGLIPPCKELTNFTDAQCQDLSAVRVLIPCRILVRCFSHALSRL